MMKLVKLYTIVLILIQQLAFSNNNPVVTIYDGCIVRFGGKFYAMGTGTEGKIYWSNNMTSWSGPLLVAKSDEAQWLNDTRFDQRDTYPRIGAGDIVYYNGLFHIYFNGIGHSVSTWPTTLFKETSITQPFSVYDIDAQLFIDKNGSPIFIKKVQTVHPITGLSIGTAPKQTWMFPLRSAFSFGDSPITGDKQGVFLNSGQKGRNDHIDKNNFEGPELYSYRNQYYLLNSANCMSARTGLYNTYCTQASTLATMGNNGKYPLPPLERNLEKFHRQYKVIAPFSEYGEWKGRMTTTTPATTWKNIDFDDSSWTHSSMGIGAPDEDRDVAIRHVRTLWNNTWTQLFIRREIQIDTIPTNPFLLYRLEGGVEYYLNGTLLFTESGAYNGWRTKAISKSAFVVGKNVISVKCTPGNSTRYMDFGLYDAGLLKVEDLVIGPSQSNLLVGLNGFEHFVVYKAFFNGVSGQGVDRVFFQNKELVVDGPTTSNSNGTHYAPSQPSLFEEFDRYPSKDFWDFNLDDWRISNDRIKSLVDNSSMLTKGTATSYFLETSFSLPSSGSASAGIYAWYADASNYIEIVLSREKNQWIVNTLIDSILTTEVNTLPSKFMFFEPNSFVQETTPAVHELRAYKNGSSINVWLDHILLTAESPLQCPSDKPGKVGIHQVGKLAEFEHITYTKGWDEFDNSISEWQGNNDQWISDPSGIHLKTNKTNGEIMKKGDLLTNYNFECNVTNTTLPSSGKTTLYPVFSDDRNFIKASLNYATKRWEVLVKANGVDIQSISAPATTNVMRGHTLTSPYTGTPTNEYRYDLKGESEVSQIKVLWMEGAYPFLTTTFGIPLSYKVQYLENGVWKNTPNQSAIAQKLSIYNTITFDAVKTSALKIVVTPNTLTRTFCRPYDVEVKVDLPSTFFFRSVRQGNETKLFYNNDLIATIAAPLPASQVAIESQSASCAFNGIMCYQNSQMPEYEIISSIHKKKVDEQIQYKVDVSKKKVIISPMSNSQYSIRISNILGQQKVVKDNVSGIQTFDLNNIEAEVLLISIFDSANYSTTKKIIIN